MILELVGSRVVAPYLGTSTFVWTSLIGVILGSLSIGYSWGGRLADRGASYDELSRIILSAATAVFATALINPLVLTLTRMGMTDLRLAAVVSAIILFAPASIALGLVSPYAVRLRLSDMASSGRTIGRLSSISTAGSIVGTFLSGFVLITYLGTLNILTLLSALLLLTSLFTRGTMPKGIDAVHSIVLASSLIGFSILSLSPANATFIDIDTHYSRVWIRDTKEAGTNKPIRYLITDPFGAQSGMYLEEDTLAYLPGRFFRLTKYFTPYTKNALLIGGAPFIHPTDFIKRHPDATLDVVEIDEQMTEIAKGYFRFSPDPRITITNEDGRTFLNRNKKIYDTIFVDAFGATFSPPFQLNSIEAVDHLHRSLSANGVVMVNLLSAIEGDDGRFLRALAHTYRQRFPFVSIYPMSRPADGESFQGILLVASKNELGGKVEEQDGEIQELLSHRWKTPLTTELPILTDNFAPVESYLSNAQMGRKAN